MPLRCNEDQTRRNLPASLAAEIVALGHDADTAISEGLAGHEDSEVWAGARSSERMLITQDLDFSDVREFAPGGHHGLVLVRLREPGQGALKARVLQVFQQEAINTWGGCFVVITDRKVRVRRRPAS